MSDFFYNYENFGTGANTGSTVDNTSGESTLGSVESGQIGAYDTSSIATASTADELLSKFKWLKDHPKGATAISLGSDLAISGLQYNSCKKNQPSTDELSCDQRLAMNIQKNIGCAAAGAGVAAGTSFTGPGAIAAGIATSLACDSVMDCLDPTTPGCEKIKKAANDFARCEPTRNLIKGDFKTQKRCTKHTIDIITKPFAFIDRGFKNLFTSGRWKGKKSKKQKNKEKTQKFQKTKTDAYLANPENFLSSTLEKCDNVDGGEYCLENCTKYNKEENEKFYTGLTQDDRASHEKDHCNKCVGLGLDPEKVVKYATDMFLLRSRVSKQLKGDSDLVEVCSNKNPSDPNFPPEYKDACDIINKCKLRDLGQRTLTAEQSKKCEEKGFMSFADFINKYIIEPAEKATIHEQNSLYTWKNDTGIRQRPNASAQEGLMYPIGSLNAETMQLNLNTNYTDELKPWENIGVFNDPKLQKRRCGCTSLSKFEGDTPEAQEDNHFTLNVKLIRYVNYNNCCSQQFDKPTKDLQDKANKKKHDWHEHALLHGYGEQKGLATRIHCGIPYYKTQKIMDEKLTFLSNDFRKTNKGNLTELNKEILTHRKGKSTVGNNKKEHEEKLSSAISGKINGKKKFSEYGGDDYIGSVMHENTSHELWKPDLLKKWKNCRIAGYNGNWKVVTIEGGSEEIVPFKLTWNNYRLYPNTPDEFYKYAQFIADHTENCMGVNVWKNNNKWYYELFSDIENFKVKNYTFFKRREGFQNKIEDLFFMRKEEFKSRRKKKRSLRRAIRRAIEKARAITNEKKKGTPPSGWKLMYSFKNKRIYYYYNNKTIKKKKYAYSLTQAKAIHDEMKAEIIAGIQQDVKSATAARAAAARAAAARAAAARAAALGEKNKSAASQVQTEVKKTVTWSNNSTDRKCFIKPYWYKFTWDSRNSLHLSDYYDSENRSIASNGPEKMPTIASGSGNTLSYGGGR